MTTATTTRRADNGVNVDALLTARAALTDAPEGAQFTWRATSQWVNGTHSRATVDGFFGLGQEQRHRRSFDFDVDHPEIFAATDNGATPVELMLVGLAGCLSAGIASVAQHRNLQLHSVRATLEAGMDLQGVLGIDERVRNGFDGIRVHYEIDADATPEQIAALVAQSQKRSAVFDIIANPTDIRVTSSKA
ncbi:OsmC family protein [Aquabacterium sp.]|uniref:OsmC family protein n=1 Tax=Aquabacterium sp. TaxID=1872578 RepID=UPI003783FD26